MIRKKGRVSDTRVTTFVHSRLAPSVSSSTTVLLRPAVRSRPSDTLRKITVALRRSLLSHDFGAKLRDVFGKASPAPLICRPLSVGSSFPYFFPSQFLENDSFHYKLSLM